MDQDEMWPGNRVETPARVINADDERYERFVAAYCENGFNGTRAAIAAGYSEATAYSQASRLLRRPEIADAIARKTRDRVEELDHSSARVLQEVARLAFVDQRRYIGSDGRAKRFVDLDEDCARALASVELTEDGRLKKFKIFDKGPAQDKLMRFHSMYKDKLEMDGELTLVMDV